MDIEVLAEELGLEKAGALRIVRTFLDSTAQNLVQLTHALEEQDTDEVTRMAHHIKGAAGNLELTAISEAALMIEEQAKNKDLRGAEQQAATILKQLKALREELSLEGA
jgi:HPt (histidine-containing phosphotransfer) domain-containing protein